MDRDVVALRMTVWTRCWRIDAGKISVDRLRDKPPSAASSAPATNGQRAEARKSTARAISAAEPRRPRGVAALADGYAAYNALGDTSMLTMFSPEFYDNEALPT